MKTLPPLLEARQSGRGQRCARESAARRLLQAAVRPAGREEDRARYAEEMALPAHLAQFLTKGKKLPTDPGAPMDARSAFTFFCTAERAKCEGASPPSGRP